MLSSLLKKKNCPHTLCKLCWLQKKLFFSLLNLALNIRRAPASFDVSSCTVDFSTLRARPLALSLLALTVFMLAVRYWYPSQLSLLLCSLPLLLRPLHLLLEWQSCCMALIAVCIECMIFRKLSIQYHKLLLTISHSR